jgi:hypothetical protein
MGSIDLTALTRIGDGEAEALLPSAHYIAPDDGNTADRTVLAVPLRTPVPPGGSIELDLAWTAHVPRTFDRTGVIGRYFFIAQWFPKIGVLEDDGWNCHQFHAATEFFADYGRYDVQLTVPHGWVVGATGREGAVTRDAQGADVHHFVESDVHDFAWTTSPDFVDVRDTLHATGLPDVDVRLLLQPEHRDQADRQLAAVRAALDRFGRWFGPYPYGHLTIVDPVTVVNPETQGGTTGGMEYPTLIVGDSRWDLPWGDSSLEDVLVHETGHQFWYGVVGTNEFEHAWMDEGLTEYSTGRVLADAYPGRFVAVDRYFGGLVPWSYRDVPWSRELDGDWLPGYRRAPDWNALSTPTWRDWPGTADATTYAKTALWLEMLERRVGWPMMQRVLATYFAEGAFRHPTPDEFFATASRVTGQDLTPFFDAVYRSSDRFDYAIANVIRTPAAANTIDSTVVVRRRESGIFPVDVRVTFDDGSQVTEHWDGRDAWHAIIYHRASGVRTAEVDPDHRLLLDLNVTNNSWTVTPRAAQAASRWAARWLVWLQNAMLTYAFFS